MYRHDVPRTVVPERPSPNAEPELLTWHDVIAQRPHITLGRFYWDQKTQRLWYAELVVDGVAVELLTRMKSVRGWPGFIIAADLDAYLDHKQGLRAELKTPRGRKKSVCYKPQTPGRAGSTARWLVLTTGTVGAALLDEIEHTVKVARAGEVTYVHHTDIHAVKADPTLQSTVEQWSTAWATISHRLNG